jgi:hypothetical protein
MDEGAAMYTLHAVIVFWVLVPTSGESFRSTTGVYSRPSQLFINKIVYVRAHTRPRPRAYACVRTLATRSSRQSILGGDCPCRLCPVRNV